MCDFDEEHADTCDDMMSLDDHLKALDEFGDASTHLWHCAMDVRDGDYVNDEEKKFAQDVYDYAVNIDKFVEKAHAKRREEKRVLQKYIDDYEESMYKDFLREKAEKKKSESGDK